MTKTDHWKNHSEGEDPGCTIGFTKHWVPAAQLWGIGTKHNTVGEKHISIPLTNHWISGDAERTREETFGILHICGLRMPQGTASLEENSVPNEVTSSHILERHIPQVAGRQWMSKRRPSQKGRIGLSPKHPWGVGRAGEARWDLRQWPSQIAPYAIPVCAALRPRRGAQRHLHLSVQSAIASGPPGTWWVVRAHWRGQG